MHELITTDQVKKVYRKAVLHIHPDKVVRRSSRFLHVSLSLSLSLSLVLKLRDDPNEQLAKLIFVELNEAWAQFQSEANE